MLRNGPSSAFHPGEKVAVDAAAGPGTRDDSTAGDDTAGDSGLGSELLALRRLDATAMAAASREELLGVLSRIERLNNRLAGYRTEVLGALAVLDRCGAAPDASPHLSLRDAAGVAEREARQMTRVAQKVRNDQPVLAALRGGDITPTQAEALCDARVPEPVRAELLAAAAREDADATHRGIRQAEAEHCTEASSQRYERQRRARGAGWLRDHEGMLKLWARFDPHTGAQIAAALEPLRRELWLHDKQVRADRRSPAQRDADTLAYALAGITATDADADAVRKLHARANGRPPGTPPSQRHAPEHAKPERDKPERDKPGGDLRADARHEPGIPQRDEFDHAAAPTTTGGGGGARWLPSAQISILIDLEALRLHTDEMGLTDAGTELPPEIVRAHACDAQILPVILGGPGGTADIGRSSRNVPLRLRRLLVARDRHCRWPGCAEPPSRCDAHHVVHWIDGGPTDLDNLVLLCHRHHHHLHKHRCRIIRQPDGTWDVTQPAATPQRSHNQARAP